MRTDSIEIIDKKIEELVNDPTKYDFVILKEKVESILNGVDIFLSNNHLDTKAVDLYLKIVITKRNKLQQKKEERAIIKDTKVSKYVLIEEICKKLDFENNEEVIKKIEELESKSTLELETLNGSL